MTNGYTPPRRMYAILPVAWMLTACANGSPPALPPLPANPIPAHLVAPVPALPMPASGSLEALKLNHLQSMARFKSLVDDRTTLRQMLSRRGLLAEGGHE